MNTFPKNNKKIDVELANTIFNTNKRHNCRYTCLFNDECNVFSCGDNVITNTQLLPKHIFILAGQSNMMGKGGVLYDQLKHPFWDGIVPPDNTPDPDRIFRLAANLTWEVARDPLHVDIDPVNDTGVGPGMTFANIVKEHTFLPFPIGLVPCAIGGSKIESWARGEKFYEDMVNRSRVAAMSGVIKALLWYQGESDIDDDGQVNSYRQNMVNLILNVRADLELPFLPVIQVAIASGDKRFYDRVRFGKLREIQKSIELPNVWCVDAWGLEIGADYVHLTTQAQVQLGHILAQAYLHSTT